MPWTRKAAALLLIMAMMLLSGCLGVYSFDFILEGDFEDGLGSWYLDSGGHVFSSDGLWVVDTYLTAPYSYKGDFTCTFEVFINNEPGKKIEWMSFILVNDKLQKSVPAAKFFGFTIHNYGASTEYSVWQGAAAFDYYNVDEMPPGMINNAVNIVKIKKTGQKFKVWVNEIPVYTMTILPSNNSEYWYPTVSGTYDYSMPYGFFIRRVSVTYTKGNELEAPWAFV